MLEGACQLKDTCVLPPVACKFWGADGGELGDVLVPISVLVDGVSVVISGCPVTVPVSCDGLDGVTVDDADDAVVLVPVRVPVDGVSVVISGCPVTVPVSCDELCVALDDTD